MEGQQVNDKEIALTIKLAAVEAAQTAVQQAKLEWIKDLQLHAATCPGKTLSKRIIGTTAIVCAFIGSGILPIFKLLGFKL